MASRRSRGYQESLGPYPHSEVLCSGCSDLFQMLTARNRAVEAKEQDKAYRAWLKAQGKEEKEWGKADEKERKEYWRAQKKADKRAYPVS